MSDHINYVDLNNERRYFEDSAGRSGVAPVEATAIASKAYAVGDYFWYSNILYKVTTTIASGGSIVPGTNVTQVTLSDEVNQLNRQLSDKDLFDDIPGTTQTVTFDSNDQPASIVHTSGADTVRTDIFTWADGTVTEVRTLADGRHVTYVTNLTTLVTTISAVEEAT